MLKIETVKIKCKGCGSVYRFRIDTNVVNPKKLIIYVCGKCKHHVREREFKAISKRKMKKKEIKVKDVPGMKITAEIKPVKSRKYG